MIMNINVICSKPESMGPEVNAADGIRDVVWPIVGGRFSGPGISGRVLPGGGDFPVTRPDGGVIIDALYRLQTDDGYQIIIHNKGLGPKGVSVQKLSKSKLAPLMKDLWQNEAYKTTAKNVGKRMLEEDHSKELVDFIVGN